MGLAETSAVTHFMRLCIQWSIFCYALKATLPTIRFKKESPISTLLIYQDYYDLLALLGLTRFLRLTLQILVELLKPRPGLRAHAKPPKRRSKNATELLAV